MSYQFYVPTRTLFGAGKLNELHAWTMPGEKARVVISNGKSARETGALDRTLKELRTLAKNACDTMGGLLAADPCELSQEECVAIYQKSYR